MLLVLLLLNIILLSSSLDWIILWVGLEINTFIFLSINKSVTKLKTEFEFKYFIVQFFGSSVFLIGWLCSTELLLFISIMIKLMLLPFLNWVLESLKWISSKLQLIFLSIQKIGPFFLLWSLQLHHNIEYKTFLIFNLFVSMLMGINLSHWMDLLVISSNGQSVLIIILLLFSKAIGLIYLFVYMTSVVFFLIFYKFNQETIFMFIFISGFPPSLIFFAKLNFLLMLPNLGLSGIIIFTLFFSTMFFVYMKIFILKFSQAYKVVTSLNSVKSVIFILLLWACFG
uniref:NADH dehydrogenase subunit 2 n=1 Tax=Liposcelis bostrychophila TaxID=185214 RepID=H9M5L3_LIPBO|nr:NADH dehydrogenase subunit 2 [Liposcelis bostrychophila]ATU74613.1 NADH dehydrogenase subunit 2 [Liposcelis bostrychophila]ATU74626.1 NADH dehydrogenase subunit 2 [Liposcelis bostrychophila]